VSENANMTEEQEKHLSQVKEWFLQQVDAKYRRGQAEHGGNLWLKPVLPMLVEEVIDLSVYVQTLQLQVLHAHNDLQNAIASKDWTAVAEVLSRLTAQLRPPVE